MKKNIIVPLPAEITLLAVIGELVNTHAVSLHSTSLSGAQQSSHPGADFTGFPMISLIVEKAKEHTFDSSQDEAPYLIVRSQRFSDRGYFVRIEGLVEDVSQRDNRLLCVRFKATKLMLKKIDTIATKESWEVPEAA